MSLHFVLDGLRCVCREHHMSDKLRLDVGGTIFHTTYTTLSRERGSMLARMFGGEFRPAAEESGNYFIDRDGTHFRYILNYLRDGTVELPQDEQLHKELLIEATYYGLDIFVEGLRVGFPCRQPILPGMASASHSCSHTSLLLTGRLFTERQPFMPMCRKEEVLTCCRNGIISVH